MLLSPCTVLSPRRWVKHHQILFLTTDTEYARVFVTHLGLQHTWAEVRLAECQTRRSPDLSLGDSCPERAPTYTDCGIESLELQTTRVLVKYDLKPAPNHSLTPLWSLCLIFAPPLQLHSNHGSATLHSSSSSGFTSLLLLLFSKTEAFKLGYKEKYILLISFVRSKYFRLLHYHKP